MITQDPNHLIEKKLARFQSIRERRLRRLFDILPTIVVATATISTFARWYSQHTILWTYISGGLAFTISLLVMRDLFRNFPQALLVVWRRKLLRQKEEPAEPSSDSALDRAFLGFLEESENYLNSKASYWFGLLLMLVIMWIIWILARERISGLSALFRNEPFAAVVSTVLLLAY